MFSLKRVCQLLLLMMATLSTSLAHAQVFCFQYPVYIDEYGNYIFDCYAYASDPAGCDQSYGEWYLWVTPDEIPPGTPQMCGSGACIFNDSSAVVGGLQSTKGEKDDGSATRPSSKLDRPMKELPNDLFVFGKDSKGNSMPSMPPKTKARPNPEVMIPDPSAGIFAQTGDLIWVKSTKGLIPVRTYRVIIDYDLAGVPASVQPKGGRTRKLYFGIEVKTTEQPPDTGVNPMLRSDFKYSGIVQYANPAKPEDIHGYHIVTKTPLQ